MNSKSKNHPSVETIPFGKTVDGKPVSLFVLTNTEGMKAEIIDYGGIVVSLFVPDANGTLGNVVLGLDSIKDYEACDAFLGALIGRYGNRIAGGQFQIDGETFRLEANNGPNHLHGGSGGFHQVVWSGHPIADEHGAYLDLTYVSDDGDEGYPGKLDVTVRYTLTNQNELRIDYKASTDKTTHVNLTHHSYFDLSAGHCDDVLDHLVQIRASHFTPVDSTQIPTGDIQAVEGTPFDFTELTAIGENIGVHDPQLATGAGYDHNYVLDGDVTDNGLVQAAVVVEPESGRAMEVWTTEPGIQFYSGNFLDGSLRGQGRVYRQRAGFCLETQHYPDSPNRPEFPSTLLQPDETYSSTTVYRFLIADDT